VASTAAMLQLIEPEISASASPGTRLQPPRQPARLLRPARRPLTPFEYKGLDRREPQRMVPATSLQQIQAPTHLETQATRLTGPSPKLRVQRLQSLDRASRSAWSLRSSSHPPGKKRSLFVTWTQQWRIQHQAVPRSSAAPKCRQLNSTVRTGHIGDKTDWPALRALRNQQQTATSGASATRPAASMRCRTGLELRCIVRKQSLRGREASRGGTSTSTIGELLKRRTGAAAATRLPRGPPGVTGAITDPGARNEAAAATCRTGPWCCPRKSSSLARCTASPSRADTTSKSRTSH
jgi:hypothetical protein